MLTSSSSTTGASAEAVEVIAAEVTRSAGVALRAGRRRATAGGWPHGTLRPVAVHRMAWSTIETAPAVGRRDGVADGPPVAVSACPTSRTPRRPRTAPSRRSLLLRLPAGDGLSACRPFWG